ncbi:unannotated protein [freshwater metagenome]|uniref:Unannotated protein n=2 Tax=root TaxID=1 RepID=A0A6J7ABB3_9ZZZZ
MLSSISSPTSGNILDIQWDKWMLREMIFTPDKMKWLWETMQGYKTLFSDLTRGKLENFVDVVLLPDSFWVEVVEKETEQIIGIMYVTDLRLVIDASVHLVFFDRKPVEKSMICRFAIEWMFKNFPLQRLTAYVPSIYWMTIKLAKNIGFVEEGRRRQALLIGNRWVDQMIFGILRREVIG